MNLTRSAVNLSIWYWSDVTPCAFLCTSDQTSRAALMIA
jgi:hypothetical protein